MDLFDRQLECWWKINHSELVFQDEEVEATPATLAASSIWAGRFPTPGERCNSCLFLPRRPLLKGAAELGELVDPERGAEERERGWGRCSTLLSFPFHSNKEDLHTPSSLYVSNLLKQSIFQEADSMFSPLMLPGGSKWPES